MGRKQQEETKTSRYLTIIGIVTLFEYYEFSDMAIISHLRQNWLRILFVSVAIALAVLILGIILLLRCNISRVINHSESMILFLHQPDITIPLEESDLILVKKTVATGNLKNAGIRNVDFNTYKPDTVIRDSKQTWIIDLSNDRVVFSIRSSFLNGFAQYSFPITPEFLSLKKHLQAVTDEENQ